MTPKFKTRDVERAAYINYLKRAEECFHAAKTSFGSQEWNAAAINAVHAGISACDAICVYFLGKRNAGESHNDAVVLFRSITPGDERINTNANRLGRIVDIKNLAEYEDRLIVKTEAEKVLKDCERLLEFIKKELPMEK